MTPTQVRFAAMMMALCGALFAAGLVAPVAASPLACAGTCNVDAHSLGYRPPAIEVANGSSVVWHSLDTSHEHAETALLSVNSCFSVGSGDDDSLPVKFTIDGDVLKATVNGTTNDCENAVGLPDGSFVVAYHCVFHALTMRGTLVVSP